VNKADENEERACRVYRGTYHSIATTLRDARIMPFAFQGLVMACW